MGSFIDTRICAHDDDVYSVLPHLPHFRFEKLISTTTKENPCRGNQYETCGIMIGSPRVLHHDKVTKILLNKDLGWN